MTRPATPLSIRTSTWRAVASRSSDWSGRNWVVTAGKTPDQVTGIVRSFLLLSPPAGIVYGKVVKSKCDRATCAEAPNLRAGLWAQNGAGSARQGEVELRFLQADDLRDQGPVALGLDDGDGPADALVGLGVVNDDALGLVRVHDTDRVIDVGTIGDGAGEDDLILESHDLAEVVQSRGQAVIVAVVQQERRAEVVQARGAGVGVADRDLLRPGSPLGRPGRKRTARGRGLCALIAASANERSQADREDHEHRVSRARAASTARRTRRHRRLR